MMLTIIAGSPQRKVKHRKKTCIDLHFSKDYQNCPSQTSIDYGACHESHMDKMHHLETIILYVINIFKEFFQ